MLNNVQVYQQPSLSQASVGKICGKICLSRDLDMYPSHFKMPHYRVTTMYRNISCISGVLKPERVGNHHSRTSASSQVASLPRITMSIRCWKHALHLCHEFSDGFPQNKRIFCSKAATNFSITGERKQGVFPFLVTSYLCFYTHVLHICVPQHIHVCLYTDTLITFSSLALQYQ